MVAALTLQKSYLPLAELEPQLWYDPFPASAYQGMVAAQEEVRSPIPYIRASICLALLPCWLTRGGIDRTVSDRTVVKLYFLGNSIE